MKTKTAPTPKKRSAAKSPLLIDTPRKPGRPRKSAPAGPPVAAGDGKFAAPQNQSALARLKYRQERIPLGDIVKSRVIINPRTTFGTPADKEMIESIQRHGILDDLWVRELVAGVKGRYELIAGERRWVNGKAAGVADAPCKIWLDCDDNSARELQVIENLQRENISAIEEGRAFARLLKENGYSVEPDPAHLEKPSLMAEFNKSKTYIYGRIKLANGPRLLVESLEAGKIEPSTALLVARIPDPKMQVECATEIMRWGTSGMSHKNATEHIEKNYMRQLKGAPFDTTDATLVAPLIEHHARIGGGACTDCPMRSGNQGDLFQKGRADVCTNPSCYQMKCDAAAERKLREHKEAGGAVIDGKAAEKIGLTKHYSQVSGQFVNLGQKCSDDPKQRTFGQILGDKKPAVTLARAQDGSGEVYEIVDRKIVQRLLSDILPKPKARPKSAFDLKWERENAERKLNAAADDAAADAVSGAIMAAFDKSKISVMRDESLLRLFVGFMCQADCNPLKVAVRRGLISTEKPDDCDDDDAAAAIRKAAEKLTITDLLALITELLMTWDLYGGETEEFQNAVAKLLDVDVSAIEQKAREQYLAAHAPKEKPAVDGGVGKDVAKAVEKSPPKSSGQLTPEARAKIAAAMKARWTARKKDLAKT